MTHYFYKLNIANVHASCLPNNFRLLIVGSSGSGKTTLLMKLLLEKNLVNYDKLYVFAKSLYQPEYRILIAGFEHKLSESIMLKLLNAGDEIKDEKYWKSKINEDDEDIPSIESVAAAMSTLQKKPSKLGGEFHNSSDAIPDPADLDKSIKTLMIFYDIMTDKIQDPASNYFTRGRTANCDSIYLSQNYTKLPLHTVRSYSNIMIFFKSSPLVVEQLFINYASVDMTMTEFKELCKKYWEKKYSYLVIDLTRDYETGHKYRNKLEL